GQHGPGHLPADRHRQRVRQTKRDDQCDLHQTMNDAHISGGAAMMRSETRRAQDQVMRSLLLAWSRAALILTAAVAYLLGFAPLYGAWGAGVAALSALPVVAAGFLLGLRAGLIIGLLSLPVNALLMHLA